MKSLLPIAACLILVVSVSGSEVRLSQNETLVVSVPAGWRSAPSRSASVGFPFDTISFRPTDERNLSVLISILAKDKQEFLDQELLKTILRGDCRSYVTSPTEMAQIEVQALSITGGIGFYVTFTDPDLVGKPPKKGDFKTATPVIFAIGSRYLLKATILADDPAGSDFADAMAIISSVVTRE